MRYQGSHKGCPPVLLFAFCSATCKGAITPGGVAGRALTGPAGEGQVGGRLFARFHWLRPLRVDALLFGDYPFPHTLLTAVA